MDCNDFRICPERVWVRDPEILLPDAMCRVDTRSIYLVIALSACPSLAALENGKQVMLNNGQRKEALHLFEQMLRSRMKTDDIIFIGVISACSHAGLVNEGCEHFNSMIRDHCIIPKTDLYTCLIDLLGCAGHLGEAEQHMKSMLFEPDAVVWGALLAACRIHGNMDLGKRAAEGLLELKPQNDATYVLLANIYATGRRWDDVAKARK